MAVLSTTAALSRPDQWQQWPFYQPEAQISRFGLRMADFILSRASSVSAARPSHFFIKGWRSKWPLYQGRPAAMAISSKLIAVLSRPASLSGRSVAVMAVLARSPDLGYKWLISYCPVQAVYQRPCRAIFIKARGRFIKGSGGLARSPRFGLRIADFILSRRRSLSTARPSHFYQMLAKRVAALSKPASRWPFYQGRPAAMAVLSKPMAVSSRLRMPDGRFIKANGRFIKAL